MKSVTAEVDWSVYVLMAIVILIMLVLYDATNRLLPMANVDLWDVFVSATPCFNPHTIGLEHCGSGGQQLV